MALFRQGTLAQQTSQVFQMTLDELQSSIAGSANIGSMNLEEFLAQVWDAHGADAPLPQAPVQNAAAPSMNNGSTDYSGKTVEEVWQAIQAGKSQSGEPIDSVNLGSFLQSVGVDMPPSISTELHNTTLSLPQEKPLELETMRMPEEAQMPLIVPQQSAAMPTSQMYYQDSSTLASEEFRDLQEGVHASATVQTAPRFDSNKPGRLKRKAEFSFMGLDQEPIAPMSKAAGRRKRKEPEIVDEKTARAQKRMVKNRESAARSRARKQEYTAQLEVQVHTLKQENRALMEKTGSQALQVPLRRTRTLPTLSEEEALISAPLSLSGRS